MNATQAVFGLQIFFVHGISVHIDEVDLSLSFVGAVTCEVAYFSAVETGIIGGIGLVGIRGSFLEVLVSSSASFLVSLSTPIRIGSAKIHGCWLVIHTRWGIGHVILWGLSGVVRVVSSVKERVSLLIVLWSQGISRCSSFLSAVPRLQDLA
jgi:hypothetical protein